MQGNGRALAGVLAVVLLSAAVRLGCGVMFGRFRPHEPHFVYTHPDGEPRHLSSEWMPLVSPVLRSSPVVDGRELVAWSYQRVGGEIPLVPWITIASTAIRPGEEQRTIRADHARLLGWVRALVDGFPFQLDAANCGVVKKHVRCRAEGTQADGATQHLLVDLRTSSSHAFVTIWRGLAVPDERELDRLIDRLDL